MRRFLARIPDSVAIAGAGMGGPAPSLPPGSAQFAGAGSLSLATGVPVPNGQGLTVAFWIKHPGTGTSIPNVISQTTNPSAAANNMFWFGFEAGLGLTRWVAYAADTSNSSPGGTGIDADNNWHLLVLTYEDSVPNTPTTQFYKDNIPSASSAGMTLPMHSNNLACSLVIGSGFGDGFGSVAGGSTCNIDSLFIWQRQISAGEANTLWAGGAGVDASALTGSLATSLFAAYNLDGPIAGVWQDSSGNGNHLSVSGTVTVGPPRNM